MTLLEFLARAAPTGIVAPDLLVLVEPAGLDGLGQRDLVAGHVGRVLGPRRDRRGLPRGGRDRRLAGRRVTPRVAVGAGVTAADRPGWAGRLLLLFHLDLDVEDVARELVPDVVHEGGEHLEALVLVRDERIDLREA